MKIYEILLESYLVKPIFFMLLNVCNIDIFVVTLLAIHFNTLLTFCNFFESCIDKNSRLQYSVLCGQMK